MGIPEATESLSSSWWLLGYAVEEGRDDSVLWVETLQPSWLCLVLLVILRLPVVLLFWLPVLRLPVLRLLPSSSSSGVALSYASCSLGGGGGGGGGGGAAAAASSS